MNYLQYEEPLLELIKLMEKRYKQHKIWAIRNSELPYLPKELKELLDLLVEKSIFISSLKSMSVEPSKEVALMFNHIMARKDMKEDTELTLSPPLLELVNSLEDTYIADNLEVLKQKYVGKRLTNVPLNLNVNTKVVGFKKVEGIDCLELEVLPMKKIDNILVPLSDVMKG